MSSICRFVFDSVVTQYTLTIAKPVDPQNVTVVMTLGSKTLHITPSRHNVNEFKPNTGLEFSEDPYKLREILEKCGIPIQVKLGSQVVGSGILSLPQTNINRIVENMSDLMLSDTVTLNLRGKVVGTIDILSRLIVKCEEATVKEDKECRQNVDKSINPQDIMFIMGESQRCPDSCAVCPDVVLAEEGDDRLKSDLQRYQSINTNWNPQRIMVASNQGRSACCELKQMALECADIVDTITQNTGNSMQFPDHPSHSPYTGMDSQRHPDSEYCPPMYPQFTHLPAQEKVNNVTCQPALIPIPISDLNKPDIKPSRFCPVCLTNMSWLPKFASCPKCGVKPTPVLEDRHKEKKLTAEQILVDYLGKKPEDADDFCESPCEKKRKEEEKLEQQQTECRCTCKYGKLCAHCRIRKLCADIFQAEEKTVCPIAKLKSSDDYCTIIENSEECRPYLTRVFSELRDLYNVKENKVLTAPERICGKAVQTSTPKESKTAPKSKPRKIPEVQKPKVVKKPLLGHKHCVNERTAVSRYHGWDWKTTPEYRKHGWRPGYILKPIKRLMNFFLQYLPEDNAYNTCKRVELAARDKRKTDPPILNICKKNGAIYITLQAVNATMPPKTFKIVKSEFAKTLREIKRRLKEKGFRKCTCHRSLLLCVCRNFMEKKQLAEALQKECKCRGMQNCVADLVLTDTSDSEMEYDIDVSPPAGTVKQKKLIKTRKVSKAVQTSRKDKIVKPKYPSPPYSKYWRPYDCATADRYTSSVYGVRGSSMTPANANNRKGVGSGGGSGKDPGSGKGFIPVRMPKRFLKRAIEVAKAKEEALHAEQLLRAKGVNMMKYLKQHNRASKLQVIGRDGLTDAQRRRRSLNEVCLPSIDSVTHRARAHDPCSVRCVNPCSRPCYNPGPCCTYIPHSFIR